jgi:hypothetical protein
MISEQLGHFLDIPLSPLAKRIKFDPNILTIIGFIITIFASWVISFDLFLGGILILKD